MLQLTKRGNYGILAVYYIAQQPRGELISIDKIAEQSSIPKSYLGKILQDLCRGGILLSRRGSGGGFALAHDPQEITLKDIIEIIEGKVWLVSCLFVPDQCPKFNQCPIAPLWSGVQNLMNEIIESTTIADILNKERNQTIVLQLKACRKCYKEKIR